MTADLNRVRLRDKPVRHVAAVTVPANRKVIRVRIAVLHERVDAGQDVATRLRNKVRLNLQHEVVAISRRATIVGPKYEPAPVGRQRCPVVPVRAKTIAIGVGRAAMNQREHPQMSRVLLPRRKDQHALDRPAVVRLPCVRLPLRLRALAENGIEAGQSLQLDQDAAGPRPDRPARVR